MKNKKEISRLALQVGIVVFACIFAGCEPDKTCRQEMNVTAGVTLRGLQVDSTGKATEFASWDSITVQGVGNDSVLYDNKLSVTQLQLPLRSDTDVTAFTLMWHEMTETLYIHHDNTQQFVSMACGCAVFHTIDSVWFSGTWIDSVKIINSAVETVKQENIKLYTTLEN